MADERLWLMLPRPVRELPADLAAVVALVVLTDLSALFPVVRETPLRVAFGLAFVLFLPGYALVAALFPEAGEAPVGSAADGTGRADATDRNDPAADADGGPRASGIDGIERVALSFGLSIAVVPLVGLALNFTPWGIRLLPIVVSLSGVTLLATAVAASRRRALPADERFAVPYRDWLGAGRAELFEPETGTDAVLNVVLVVSVLLAVGSVGYAVAVPKPGESFTEFYLLTENETGALVADDYPTEFNGSEARPVVVGVGNHEHEPTNYTVVVELQNVSFRDNETVVHRERELGRFGTRVADNETWHTTYRLRPSMTGQRLRAAFLLYRGGAPAEPTVDNAYRETHLWVNVSSAASSTSSARLSPARELGPAEAAVT